MYSYTKTLVNQSFFNRITVGIYYEEFCTYVFVCDQNIIVLEIFSKSLFDFSQSNTFAISQFFQIVVALN